MARNTTPHTESGQNQEFDESDLEPGVSADTVARGEDAALYSDSDGAQTGTNRGAAHVPGDGPRHHDHGTHTPDTLLEGSLETRAPEGAGQGITGRSQSEESVGQKKVVADRPDVQSGINQERQKDDIA
jgi:hypothetical protein